MRIPSSLPKKIVSPVLRIFVLCPHRDLLQGCNRTRRSEKLKFCTFFVIMIRFICDQDQIYLTSWSVYVWSLSNIFAIMIKYICDHDHKYILSWSDIFVKYQDNAHLICIYCCEVVGLARIHNNLHIICVQPIFFSAENFP